MIVQGPDGQRIDFGNATPEQIKAAMAKRYGAPAQAAPPAPAMRPQDAARMVLMNTPLALPGNPSAGQAIEALPAGLGFTGGLFGGPVGAGAGGAIGEGARQLAMGEPIDTGRMVRSGAIEGAARGVGALGALAARGIGPGASRLAELLKNPAARRLAQATARLSPVGGAVSGGIPGAAAGVALPYAGRAAMKLATNPRTAAFLSSRAFQAFARYSPQAATDLARKVLLAEQPDATAW